MRRRPRIRRAKTLYRLAYDQIHANMENVKAGTTFQEFIAKAWQIPQPYRARRYFALATASG